VDLLLGKFEATSDQSIINISTVNEIFEYTKYTEGLFGIFFKERIMWRSPPCGEPHIPKHIN
jgi:hypothetical protein